MILYQGHGTEDENNVPDTYRGCPSLRKAFRYEEASQWQIEKDVIGMKPRRTLVGGRVRCGCAWVG